MITEASTPTTKAAIAKAFGAMAQCRIALEAGGHSRRDIPAKILGQFREGVGGIVV